MFLDIRIFCPLPYYKSKELKRQKFGCLPAGRQGRNPYLLIIFLEANMQEKAQRPLECEQRGLQIF